MINAVQNTALQRTLGTDAVSSRSAAVRGDFPDRVERVGRAERGTVYDNPLFTVLDTLSRLGGRPAEDAPVRAPAIGPTPASQAYGETWHGVVKPLLEHARDVQGRRLDAAPGTWQFDDFKGGEVYPGVPVPPPVPVPTAESVMGGYALNQGAAPPGGLAPRQAAEVMRTPSRFDRQTVAAIEGWLGENVMSPTRLTQEELALLAPGPDYSAPAARPIDVGAELGLNAVTGPGRYGDEARPAIVPNYGALVQQAQAQGARRQTEPDGLPVVDYEARVAAKLLAEQALARARRM